MADETRRARIWIDDKDAQSALKRLRDEAAHLAKRLQEVPHGSKEFYQISNRITQVQRHMGALNREAAQTNSWFGKIKGTVGSFSIAGIISNAVTGAIQGIGRLVESSVSAFREQERAVAKVEQALVSTGNAAGFSLRQLQDEASALQKNTLFGDERILNDATAQLLSFTNITGDAFLRTQRAAMDIATVLDGDLKSASIQLGKALNDPVANLSALSRSGIQFSAEQKDLIHTLAQTNRLGEAQAVILEELERQYGGQAEAAARADGGAQQTANAWGDVQEAVGELVSEILDLNDGNSLLLDGLNWLGAQIADVIAKVRAAKRFFREWYEESTVFRAVVVGLGTFLKSTWNTAIFTLDMLIVQPIKGMVSGVKALRKGLAGDFQGALLEMQGFQGRVTDKMQDFGQEMAGNFKDGINEVRDPTLFKDLEEDAANSNVVIPIKLDAEEMAKAAKLDALRDKLKSIRDQLEADGMDRDARELKRVQDKYAALAAEAQGDVQALVQIERLKQQELAMVRQKAGEREVQRWRKLDEQIAALRAEAEELGLDADQRAIEKERTKLEALLKEVEGHAERRAEVERLMQEKLQRMEADYAAKRAAAATATRATVDGATLEALRAHLAAQEAAWQEHVARMGDDRAAAAEAELAAQEALMQLRLELLQRETAARLEALRLEHEERKAEVELNILDEEAQRIALEDLEAAHVERKRAIVQDGHTQELAMQRERNHKWVQAEQERATATLTVARSMATVMTDMLMMAASDEDEMATFQKMSTLFQIAIDTAAAISALVKNSEANPANAVTSGVAGAVQFATGLARITTNMAKASQLLRKEPPERPAFAEGGDTGTVLPNVSGGGMVGRAIVGLFGEKGREWVGPNWMYEHPTLQPVFHWLESVRVMGRVPAYAEGGSTAPAQPAPAAQTPTPPTNDNAMLMTVVERLTSVLERGIVSVRSYDLDRQDEGRIAQIEESSNIAR